MNPIRLGIKTVLSLIIEPRFEIADSEILHEARLITATVFVSMTNIVMGAFMAPPPERAFLAWIAPAMILSYALSRTRRFRAGAAVSIASTFVLMALILFASEETGIGIIIPLAYFTATVFMVSFWLEFRWMILLVAAQYALMLPWIATDQYDAGAVLFGWLPLNSFVVTLILVSRWVQDRRETELREYRDHLEEMVELRSRDLKNANRVIEEKLEREREISGYLEKTLNQKDLLLKELYHRTKNTLQIVTSLLSLQSSGTEMAAAKDVFRVAGERINSMALVHEKLYKSGDLTNIDLASYLRDLAARLYRTHVADTERVGLEIETEPVPISIDQAIPLGLVANELLTNALRHAFPHGRKGTVRIRIARHGADAVDFEIGDDGVGLPAGSDFRSMKGLGNKLIVNIIESQLEGTLRVDSREGVRVRVRFALASSVGLPAGDAGAPRTIDAADER